MLSTQGWTFLVVAALGLSVSIVLLRFYREDADEKLPGWARKLSFTADDLGGFSWKTLALVSVFGLFTELLLIRWISAEIRIFAYFKNFVLIACFLGFGLGSYLCKRRIHLLAVIVPLTLICALIQLPITPLRELIDHLPLFIGAFSEVHFWGVPSLDLSGPKLVPFIAANLFAIPLFALVALVFLPVGQIIGRQLELAPKSISAYTVNIVGSLVGILLFTLLCFLVLPPWSWLALSGAMLIALLWRVPQTRGATIAVTVVCVVLALLPDPTAEPDAMQYWSPYQKLSLTEDVRDGEVFAYQLQTNNTWYQQVIDLSPEMVEKYPELLRDLPVELNPYNLPYTFYPDPERVLVLGAGMGNDVAAALRGGAHNVTAVEIDPVILDLGRKHHLERPYDSERVKIVVDDARAYLQNSDQKYDLIVFSLLDSHTTSSHYSNIRIDNYVYTLEAFEATKKLLADGGLMIVKFQVETPWIAGRLFELLHRVFGDPPLELRPKTGHTTPGIFYFAGSQDRLLQALSDPELREYARTHSNVPKEPARLTTDDWPYFYQQAPGLPASLVVISVVLILLCWLSIGGVGLSGGPMNGHFFFLGAGFMLLQVQIVSKMALLFGTTWLINSFVISGILTLIVGANFLVERFPEFPLKIAYAGMAATIVCSYLMPLELLFFDSLVLRALGATLVLCAPIFFASIVFIRSFAGVGMSGTALGANLLGSLVGGLLENLSLWTGLRSLLLLAALLYAVSYLLRKNPSLES